MILVSPHLLFCLVLNIFAIQNVNSLEAPKEDDQSGPNNFKSILQRIDLYLNARRYIIKDCAYYRKKGFTADGVYYINPDGRGSFRVRCDMTTDGGGWIVFQRRVDDSVDFYRRWKDYKRGFGVMTGSFWLGLEKIHQLTASTKNVLRVDMEDFSGKSRYAKYTAFSLSSESKKYLLNLGTYSGNAGDSLSGHKGSPFTTKDVDNDKYSAGNCAVTYKGAWWYTACHSSNLNGKYHKGVHSSYADGVNWYTWHGHHYSLKKTEMKFRPSNF